MNRVRSSPAVALVSVVIVALALFGTSGSSLPPADAATTSSSWSDAIAIPGLAALGATENRLTDVACTSPGNCTAVGSYTKGSSIHPLFVDQVDGVWGDAYEVPGSWAFDGDDIDRRVDYIACTPDGGCAAAGRYETGRGRRTFVTSRVGGVWTDAEPMPNASELAGPGNVGQYIVRGASCSSSGNCSIIGLYLGGTTGQGGFLVDLIDGVWQDAIDVPGLEALSAGGESYLSSVSCPVGGQCSATGSYDGTTGTHAFVVDQSDGVWGTATDVPGLMALATGGLAFASTISCSSTGNCSVGGTYIARFDADPTPLATVNPFVADRIAGTWTDAQTPVLAGVDDSGIDDVACPTDGNCSAIGRFHVPGDPVADHDSLFVLQRIGGVWTSPAPMPGLDVLNTGNVASIASLSCAAPGTCAATGHYTDATGEVPFVVNSTGGAWSAPIAVPGVRGPSIGECTFSVFGDTCPTGRAVWCPSPTRCVVVGNTYPSAEGRGFLADYYGAPEPEPEPTPAPPVFTG